MYHHGGEIYGQKVAYDFSVNVNPLGLPPKVQQFLKSEQVLYYAGVYPQNGNELLTEAIAKKERVDSSCIVCGNGASELVYAAFSAFGCGKVLLCIPSFSEYEQAARAYGWDMIFYETKEENGFQITEDILELLKKSKPELIVLCNPSNPVGNCVESGLLEKIVECAVRQGSRLLIDECFLDFVSNEKVQSAKMYFEKLANKNSAVLVLKAFTKLYAMPGLRLGYILSSDQRASDAIRAKLPEWNVSSIAQQSGIIALSDDDYVKRTVGFLREERKNVKEAFGRLGIKSYQSEANYIMWRGPLGLKEQLLKKQILIRDCSNYRGLAVTDRQQAFYRTAIRTSRENDILMDALQSFICE